MDPETPAKQRAALTRFNALPRMEVFIASDLDKVNNAVQMVKEMPAMPDTTVPIMRMEHGAAQMYVHYHSAFYDLSLTVNRA
jgi:hypothetical protein